MTGELGTFGLYAVLLYVGGVGGVPVVLLANLLGYVPAHTAGSVAVFLIFCMFPGCLVFEALRGEQDGRPA